MVSNVALAALAIMLAACQQGAEVIVSGTAQDLRFATVSQDGAKPMCADKLSVTPTTREDADPVWQITAADPAKCTIALRYGHVSDDFAEQVRAAPLRRGTVYRVRISGAGFSAVHDFHLTNQGVPANDS